MIRTTKIFASLIGFAAVFSACTQNPTSPPPEPPPGGKLLPGGVILPPPSEQSKRTPEIPVPDLEPLIGEKCALSDMETRMAKLLVNSEKQQRETLVCDAALAKFAEFRARDLIRREYFAHATPGGFGPNALLNQAGYELPPKYPGRTANTIEALAAGLRDPEKVWNALLGSSRHRRHLIAESAMYRNQDRFGIAYVRSETPIRTMRDYWVIIIARQRRPDEPDVTCTPPPAVCFKVGDG